MEIKTEYFSEAAKEAISDSHLQQALKNLKKGFASQRVQAIANLPEFYDLTEQATQVKNEVMKNLDAYLNCFEEKVIENHGQVHWASTAEDACEAVLSICRSVNARTVTKGKSMVSEEINLNEFLENNGIEPVETDLGEYILQLRKDHPSHIIAPAIHLNLEDVSAVFAEKHHTDKTLDPAELMRQARTELREKFVKADVGITGANFCIAETGSTVIVTNEGNGDLTQTLPKVHIVVTSIEKVIPNLNDLSLFLRLLARSATGQEFAVYNTLSTGPRQQDDLDGPEQFHVVLLDNGRSKMLGGPLQPMLRCIKCSACMNNCPVYGAIGGHAYGWVYPGPMGAVFTPQMISIEQSSSLPNASTLCGKCEEVCPVKIPIPELLRYWRERAFEQKVDGRINGWLLGMWNYISMRPPLYRLVLKISAFTLSRLAGTKGYIKKLPFAKSWFRYRNMPSPEGKTFFSELKNNHSEINRAKKSHE